MDRQTQLKDFKAFRKAVQIFMRNSKALKDLERLLRNDRINKEDNFNRLRLQWNNRKRHKRT